MTAIAPDPAAPPLPPRTSTAAPSAPLPPPARWSLWQKLAFRFFSIYLVLQIEPWNWFRAIPGVPYLLRPYASAQNGAVAWFNANVAHVADVLVPVNGSGDTSWTWARMGLLLSIATIGMIVWSVLDHRRADYAKASYWLRLIVRYYVAMAALSYGIIKIFLLQMPFPALSQLATPLGDLLPMRLSWLFIGYSDTYQFFSGAAEAAAGLLLLFRPTITIGILAAAGAFTNVVMINLAYDVPVKHYSSHLLFSCLFLLAFDAKRLVNLFVLNRGVGPTTLYHPPVFSKRWMTWGTWAVKVFLLWRIVWIPLDSGWTRYQASKASPPRGPISVGVYDVRKFVVGKAEIPFTSTDTLRWRDVIFDNAGAGSVGSRDGVFWQRYGRGYFRFRADTAAKTMAVWKVSAIPRDSTFLFTMRYETPDSLTVRLHTVIRGDSVHAELVRTARHFQLTERQFHWLSEYNR